MRMRKRRKKKKNSHDASPYISRRVFSLILACPKSQGYASNVPLELCYGATDVDHLLQTMSMVEGFPHFSSTLRVFPGYTVYAVRLWGQFEANLRGCVDSCLLNPECDGLDLSGHLRTKALKILQ
jgi:hypothetical protein